jgi:hypothetical protein
MLGNKLLKYRLGKQIAKERNLGSVGYKDARFVGILFSAEDLKKHEAIKKLLRNLDKDGKKVEVMSFLPTDTQNFEFKFNFFTKDEISWQGTFKSKDVLSFMTQPFDYLFYLDFESSPMMRYILAMSKAKCRIGHFDEENRPVCELMVAPELATYDSLIKEMYKYTQILT